MRIGILTLPLHTNYGGILQAYALQTILERIGHQVKIIDVYQKISKPELGVFQKTKKVVGRIVKNAFLGGHCYLDYESYMFSIRPQVTQYTNKFINTYLHQFHVNNFSDIKESDFEAYVVGSDQIWRPKYYSNIEDAYLEFTREWDVKRIAYAASFGTDKWEYTEQQTNACKSLVHKFNAVSVREDTGINLCKDYLDVDAVKMADPTLLLDKEDYIGLIKKCNPQPLEGDLFNYILDMTPEKQMLIDKIANEKGLTPFRVNAKDGNDRRISLEERIQQPVETWLQAFRDAKFIVTDSFHACVFSIIFNKPFVVVGNEKRGLSRFYSLLKDFGLEDRLITFPLNESIHVQKVGNLKDIISKKRKASIKFLEDNLNS